MHQDLVADVVELLVMIAGPQMDQKLQKVDLRFGLSLTKALQFVGEAEPKDANLVELHVALHICFVDVMHHSQLRFLLRVLSTLQDHFPANEITLFTKASL